MDSGDEEIIIDGESWNRALMDDVDLSDDPNQDCAFPVEAQTKNGRAVRFKLRDGTERPFKICFEGDAPFKNWDPCEERTHGTLVGVVDVEEGEFKYSVYIDDELICDPIIWVRR